LTKRIKSYKVTREVRGHLYVFLIKIMQMRQALGSRKPL